jgi:hypothetical protein
MSLGGSCVNVTTSRKVGCLLGARRGPKAAQPFPFARVHTDLRRSRHIFAAAVFLGFGGVGVNATC